MKIETTEITTCELCGKENHDGEPCYAELRKQWRLQAVDEWFASIPPHHFVEVDA